MAELFFPNISDGNPLTGEAVVDQIDGSVRILSGISAPLNLAHHVMTLFASGAYTENSESIRSGVLGKMVAFMMGCEVQLSHVNSEKVGVFVQEFGLMGLCQTELKHMFPNGVFLVVPDVFPKESALQAVRGKEVHFLVWNREACHDLTSRGFTADCVKPFLVSSFVDKDNFPHQGTPVVVKSSGNGLPRSWVDQIIGGIQGEQYQIHLHDSLVTPERIIHGRQDLLARANSFFQTLGAGTRLLVSYPSEVIQEVAELYLLGWRGNFVSLPPRGLHELKNIQAAMKWGICRGILGVGDGAQIAEKYRFPLIKPTQLNEHFDFRSPVQVDRILGAESVRDAIQRLSKN